MSEGIITVHHDFPIEHIEMLKDVWNKSQAEEGKVNVNSLTSVRNSKVQWLHQSNYPSLALSVSLLIKDCNKRKWGYHIDSMQPMQLSRYDSNDAHYDWHVDTMWWKSEYAYQRKLTLIVQLTDDDKAQVRGV